MVIERTLGPVGDPVNDLDVANKQYVDKGGGGGSSDNFSVFSASYTSTILQESLIFNCPSFQQQPVAQGAGRVPAVLFPMTVNQFGMAYCRNNPSDNINSDFRLQLWSLSLGNAPIQKAEMVFSQQNTNTNPLQFTPPTLNIELDPGPAITHYFELVLTNKEITFQNNFAFFCKWHPRNIDERLPGQITRR